MKLLFLLLALPALAKDITITVMPSTPYDVSKDIMYSIVDLNNGVGGNKITFVNDLFSYKVKIEYQNKDNGSTAGEAWKGYLYCKINLYPASHNVFKTTVWHEIGHCLGLSHDGNIGHIMSEKVLPFGQYSPKEVNYFLNSMKMRLR